MMSNLYEELGMTKEEVDKLIEELDQYKQLSGNITYIPTSSRSQNEVEKEKAFKFDLGEASSNLNDGQVSSSFENPINNSPMNNQLSIDLFKFSELLNKVDELSKISSDNLESIKKMQNLNIESRINDIESKIAICEKDMSDMKKVNFGLKKSATVLNVVVSILLLVFPIITLCLTYYSLRVFKPNIEINTYLKSWMNALGIMTLAQFVLTLIGAAIYKGKIDKMYEKVQKLI